MKVILKQMRSIFVDGNCYLFWITFAVQGAQSARTPYYYISLGWMAFENVQVPPARMINDIRYIT